MAKRTTKTRRTSKPRGTRDLSAAGAARTIKRRPRRTRAAIDAALSKK